MFGALLRRKTVAFSHVLSDIIDSVVVEEASMSAQPFFSSSHQEDISQSDENPSLSPSLLDANRSFNDSLSLDDPKSLNGPLSKAAQQSSSGRQLFTKCS